MNYIKKIPLPIAAVMLALAALGNLLSTYGIVYKNICGVLSALVLILLTVKIITCWKDVKNEMKNPVIAGVMPTYSMGIMLLAGYLKDISFTSGLVLWWVGVIIHLVLIILYTKNFIIGFDIKKMFPSTFIVYVGIGIAGITAPAFKLIVLGQGFFWFAFISLIVLIPLLGYRTFVVKGIPEPALPTNVIFAAPAALTLAAYLNSFSEKNIYMISFLSILVILLYICGLIFLVKGLKLKFYPSYAAFTFPMVISAIAMKGTNAFLIKIDKGISIIKYVVKFQEIVAIIIVVYVLVRFLMFIFTCETVKVENSISQ
ncbi:MAG: TDT family transporter [Clostridium sp.]|uniref:TDT family transporter n=1 Tax=Clostridium sp. TaxID=1506 RepID=UPI0030718B27